MQQILMEIGSFGLIPVRTKEFVSFATKNQKPSIQRLEEFSEAVVRFERMSQLEFQVHFIVISPPVFDASDYP